MLYLKGMRTLEDLEKNEFLLSRNQKIGLKYVKEFKIRIPRDECTEIVQIIKSVIASCSPAEYEAIACGSYRRGKPDCGDIDVLITRKDGKNPPGFLATVVAELEKSLLTDHLVLPKISPHGTETYMGVGQLRPELPHRRIDVSITINQ
jgi:DNA polymerase lambda